MLASNKRRRSSAEWRAVCARQASSGVSVQAFCARESINPSSFYRWRALSGAAQAPGDVTAGEVARVQPLRAPAEFVELGALGTSRSHIELRLDLGEGLLLTLVRG